MVDEGVEMIPDLEKIGKRELPCPAHARPDNVHLLGHCIANTTNNLDHIKVAASSSI